MSMMLTKRSAGSSRRCFTTSTIFAASTLTVSWLNAIECPVAAPGSALTIVCPRASSLPSSITKPSAFDRAGAPDLLLQQQHAVEQRFRGRRAARHVDVDRHDAVA